MYECNDLIEPELNVLLDKVPTLSQRFCIKKMKSLISLRHTHIIKSYLITVTFSLYGSETWSLTLREEHRLRVFESRMLRRIFGPKRDEIVGGWRKLLNEKLHHVYSSTDINRMIKSGRMG
jgi:hypothetical protein